ncbi:hypothetical protein NEIELOOT_00404 [Neisseria elongata subsp. glycolytica ATCC 29315]|uniref:Uncharacterized protein n=1 Tax=Neisseria elongata subsp. glycolytica ATCC 29315 TaxID=546263 RepID=D4DMY0_NEIEG|nr:hypothetical protein NEIELOOT_00404 [Neisseria elongata subsp. glycolytica ATCC 29315]
MEIFSSLGVHLSGYLIFSRQTQEQTCILWPRFLKFRQFFVILMLSKKVFIL